MKDKIIDLLGTSIDELNVFVDNVYEEDVEGKKVLNIVLDSKEVIDLNTVTKASRIINKVLDKEKDLLKDIDELDIYSKEKGDKNEW